MDDDRYTRITLRLPKELHAKLQAGADASSKSLNAQIVESLQFGEQWRTERDAFERNVEEIRKEFNRLSKLWSESRKIADFDSKRIRTLEDELAAERAKTSARASSDANAEMLYELRRTQAQLQLASVRAQLSTLMSYLQEQLQLQEHLERSNAPDELISKVAEERVNLQERLASLKNEEAVVWERIGRLDLGHADLAKNSPSQTSPF